MVSAKQILMDICETALTVPFCQRVGREVEGISVSFYRANFTQGVWTLSTPGSIPFTTISVIEAEIKLAEMLEKVQVVA